MTVETSKVGAATVLQVAGRVDAVTAPELDRVCADAIAQSDGALVLDLSGVSYISSAGLRSVLLAGKQLSGKGRKLLICGLQGVVKEVFHLSGLEGTFPIFADSAAAAASL